MKYTADTKPGMADPYWYEWSVGQSYLVDMLNPDSHIKYVELQANVQLGLDDVVITYDDEKTRFIQVKHTRTDDTFTFGDLVSAKKSEKNSISKCSLLGELARAWNLEKDNYADSEVYIFTNRKVGVIASTAGGERKIKRPSLKDFWSEIQAKISIAKHFSDLDFSQNKEAWQEWCNQLECIEMDEDKLLFLKNLHIETERESLEALGDSIKHKLQVLFNVSEEASDILLGKLDHALREWTTSIRSNAKITRENVYSVLSVKEEMHSYNHDLIPVSPFFNSRQELVTHLEEDLLNSEAKLLFLSGVPGTGKTNVISHLCSKKNSIVDIRYYAYEPIDPAKEYLPLDVSDRVKKDVFWDSLLYQIRGLLEGCLYKYKVPVFNDFLSLEEKRSEFFRIASEYARDRKRVFILAVDGIDHAARAGAVEETFLPTLPHPENLPDNVKIIIAGQPKEDYRNYPDWLYTNSEIVKEYMVPDIQSSDIENLVYERCINFTNSNRKMISNIICRYAGGNTLAAIFAVHEALSCQDPASFEEKLKARKLSGNIQEYYRAIWEDVKREMRVPFVDYKMAGVFAFFNEPICATKLNMIFKEEGISTSSWNNILKALRPLLTEKNGTYTILHNDVRVFLSGMIGRDQDHVREVYSGLANYYLSQDKKTIGYYHDVIRFLISADRLYEFGKVYTPEYIVNAYVNGVELSELTNISNELMKSTINEECLDWGKLRSMTIGYLTIEQIQKCTYEIEDVSFRNANKVIDVHPYECYFLSVDKWNSKIILEVLRISDDLFKAGEVYRGKTLFLNWFGDVTFSDIQKIVENEDDDYNHGDRRNIAILLGKTCVNSEHFELFERVSSLDEDDFLLDVLEKVEEEILDKLRSVTLTKALNSLGLLLIDPLIGGIKNMLENNRYEDLKIVRDVLLERYTENPISLMILIFLKIITGKVDWENSQSEILCKKIETVKMPDDRSEKLMSYYSIYGIVLSYLQNRSRSAIAKDIADLYLRTHKYQSSKYFLLYFNAVAFLGKWLKAKNENKVFFESIDDLKHIIENLYCKQWRPSETDFETQQLRAYILKAYIILSEENNIIQVFIRDSLEKVFAGNPVNQLLDPGMFFFRNRTERMQKWIDEWLAEGGKAWSEAIGDRNTIVKKFVEIKDKYDEKNVLSLRGAEDRIRWSIIGFASHKEYCADFLLSWYNCLVEQSPNYIPKYGKKIKNISDMIEMLGDNRMEYSLNSKIYSDLGSIGGSSIQNVLQDRRLFAQCISQPSYIVDLLIGYLQKDGFDRQNLLSVWSLGIGLLDWRCEDDHATISALQRAIEVASIKSGIADIKEDLTRLGPAYIDLASDPAKYIIPERWCDKEHVIKKVDNPKEILTNYFNDTTPSVKRSEVTLALKTLYFWGELSEDIIDQVLNFELSSDNYGINHNGILEYLFEIASDKTVDEYIKHYVYSAMKDNRFYPDQDLPAIIGWRLKYKEEEYIEACVASLINTLKCWITAAGHINEPEAKEEFDYSQYVDFNKDDVYVCLMQVLLLVLISDDADAARVALGGILALLRTNIDYISQIEDYWNRLHYRAKEWVVMIYEFVYSLCPEHQNRIYECLVKHTTDEDFNVALYSKLLCENIDSEFEKRYAIERKKFFSSVPSYGQKKLIKTHSNNPWINGSECVLKQLALLERRLQSDLEDIERRTAVYTETMTDEVNLIPIYRQKSGGGCRVVCEKVNMAFYRVLYKDWYEGRWKSDEAELARVILSASEPFTLLLSPNRWKWNDGILFSELNKVISASDKERNGSIEKILETGIDEEEIVLAGVVEDYTYNQRVFGFLLGYLDMPNITEKCALSVVERNARMFLMKRDDYSEDGSFNITIHQNGIESFKQSNIMCGFSKFILLTFKWKMKMGMDRIELVNSNDEIVGRLECFYGFRTDVGNRYPSNQPYLQRWVVKKKLLQEAIDASKCPLVMKRGVDCIITGAE